MLKTIMEASQVSTSKRYKIKVYSGRGLRALLSPSVIPLERMEEEEARHRYGILKAGLMLRSGGFIQLFETGNKRPLIAETVKQVGL